MNDDIQEMRRHLEAMTDGPWSAREGLDEDGGWWLIESYGEDRSVAIDTGSDSADAQGIAYIRNHLEPLLDEVDRWREADRLHNVPDPAHGALCADEVAELRARIRQLEEALGKYGRHFSSCPMACASDCVCTCGLDSARRGDLDTGNEPRTSSPTRVLSSEEMKTMNAPLPPEPGYGDEARGEKE